MNCALFLLSNFFQFVSSNEQFCDGNCGRLSRQLSILSIYYSCQFLTFDGVDCVSRRVSGRPVGRGRHAAVPMACPMTTTVISRPRRVLVIGPYVPQPCVHPLTAVDSVSLHPRVVLCCPPVCGFVSRRSRFFCGGAAFVLWWRPLVRTWIVIRLCGTLLCGVSRWGLSHGSYGHNWAWWGSRRAWGWFCGCFRPPWWRCAAFFP